MAPFIFLAFVIVPIVEIGIFIAAGQAIGLLPTLAVVVFTAILGTTLLRAQGLAALERARAQMDRQQMPLEEVFTGVFLLVAGALLLTPGFMTDAIGFVLFIPQVRRTVGRWVFKQVMAQGQKGPGARPGGSGPTSPGSRPRGGSNSSGREDGRGPTGQVAIDADFEIIDEDQPGAGPDDDPADMPDSQWGPRRRR